MAKNDTIEVEGKVLEVLPATMFPERATTLNPSATLSTLSPWVSKTISSF